MKVISPIGECFAAEATDATWAINPAGKIIGFLSSGKGERCR